MNLLLRFPQSRENVPLSRAELVKAFDRGHHRLKKALESGGVRCRPAVDSGRKSDQEHVRNSGITIASRVEVAGGEKKPSKRDALASTTWPPRGDDMTSERTETWRADRAGIPPRLSRQLRVAGPEIAECCYPIVECESGYT
jgi:hypothetical protein